MSWLLRSRKFWVTFTLVGSLAAIKAKDTQDLKRIKEELLKEARRLGNMPLYDNDLIRKVILIKPLKKSNQEKDEKGEKGDNYNNKESIDDSLIQLFNQYSLYLLTAAGVDYQWAQNPEKRTKERGDDSSSDPDNNNNNATSKNENKKLISMINDDNKSWIIDLLDYFNGKGKDASFIVKMDRIFDNGSSSGNSSSSNSSLLTINDCGRMFLDGIVALNRDDFDRILSQQRLWIKENRSFTNTSIVLPRTGLIDCNGFYWRDKWYGRLYWWFAQSHIAKKVGQQTLSILKEEIITDKQGIPIYKQIS